MIEETLDITTNDGEMETFICHPERNGPSPAVFLLMDAHGIREELKDMARRLATVGYYVLLSNLYYRAGRDTIFGPDVHEEGSAEHKRMRAIRTKMTIPPVMDDVGAMLSFADRQKEVKKGPVGCHGYCMSGPYALAAAARYPERIAAAASFYGTWLVSEAEESPHLSLGARSRESSTSPAPSTTIWRLCQWSRSSALCLGGPAPLVRSNCTLASITVSPSRSAGATPSRPPSDIGSG
jgi:carboxymethylenebutenolidase